MMPAEFDAALVGTKPGAATVAEFEIPDTSSNEEFVGKQARFEIEVHEVKTKVLPELDDEFAASAGGFDSMDDYRADVRRGLDETKETAHMREVETCGRSRTRRAARGRRSAGDDRQPCELDARRLLRDASGARHLHPGVPADDRASRPSKLQGDLKEQAAVRVREELALEALFRAQGLRSARVTWMTRSARSLAATRPKRCKLRESLVANGALPIMREQIMHRKALKWLIDSVTVVEEEPS